jgi:hemoglobin-like flavoprotein
MNAKEWIQQHLEDKYETPEELVQAIMESAAAPWIQAFGQVFAAACPTVTVDVEHPDAMAKEVVAALDTLRQQVTAERSVADAWEKQFQNLAEKLEPLATAVLHTRRLVERLSTLPPELLRELAPVVQALQRCTLVA